MDWDDREIRCWNLMPGKEGTPKDFISEMEGWFKSAIDIKIATAYLSKVFKEKIRFGALSDAFYIAWHNKKITHFQIDYDAPRSVPEAQTLIDMFKDSLHVVKHSNGVIHHKDILFTFEDSKILVRGSMNLSSRALNENGESIVAIKYSRTDKEPDVLFSAYAENAKYLVDREKWLTYLGKKEQREEAIKSIRRKPEFSNADRVTTIADNQLEMINKLFSVVDGAGWNKFVDMLQNMDGNKPGLLDHRKKASESLIDIMSRIEQLSVDNPDDELALRLLYAQRTRPKDSDIDYGALGNIRYGAAFPSFDDPKNCQRYLEYAQAIKADATSEIKKLWGEIRGNKKATPSIGLFSRLSSIAFPEKCFTYNGVSRAGVDYILKRVRFNGSSVDFKTYHKACEAIHAADFLGSDRLSVDERYKFIATAPMHYLDLMLFDGG